MKLGHWESCKKVILFCPGATATVQVTFKVESFVPFRVESSPLDLCLQPVFLVRQEGDPHIRVTQPIGITGSQVFTLQILIVRFGVTVGGG